MSKIFFKLPGLFEKTDLIKKVIEVYNAYPFAFKEGCIIDSVYGSNGGSLNGGRSISECKHNIKDILSFCEQNKVFPTIIMSNTLVTYEEAARDTNAIKILNNSNISTTYFCVANNEVEKWLLDNGVPSCNIISSTTKCLNEKDLEKEEKCCGNCHWFGNEDVYGVGWCTINSCDVSCDFVCIRHIN